MHMAYCSNCGEKIPEDAFFCPKCGAKTLKGAEANVKYPADEMREAFTRMGIELEKAFNTAAVEIHAAFKKASAEMKTKPAGQEAIVCQNCNAENQSGAIFCRNCGSKLSSSQGKEGVQ
jgi:ribosomal protein L40E